MCSTVNLSQCHEVQINSVSPAVVHEYLWAWWSLQSQENRERQRAAAEIKSLLSSIRPFEDSFLKLQMEIQDVRSFLEQ